MHPHCTIPECERSLSRRGLCKAHYLRLQRYGDPLGGRHPVGITATQRFWSKVDKAKECWLWMGWRDRGGYGRFSFKGSDVAAYRFAYELLIGPIPEGFILDHLCRNPPCVNPAHLEPVTTRENLLRGTGVAARNAIKTHCPNGHLYDIFNTYYYPGKSKRRCRVCRRLGETRRKRIAK